MSAACAFLLRTSKLQPFHISPYLRSKIEEIPKHDVQLPCFLPAGRASLHHFCGAASRLFALPHQIIQLHEYISSNLLRVQVLYSLFCLFLTMLIYIRN